MRGDGPAPPDRQPNLAAAPGAPLARADIIARYEGEWLLVRVTAHDEDHWPAKSRVLVHAPRQEDIVRALAARGPLAEGSSAVPFLPLYSFRAIPDVASDVDSDALLKHPPLPGPEATRADRGRPK